MKGLLGFVIGAYLGLIAGQRYHIPRTPTPSEAWQKHQAKRRERQECYESEYDWESDDVCERRRRRHRYNSEWTKEQLPVEITEAIEKIKAFERRFRKPQFREHESNPTPTAPEKTGSEQS